MPSGIALVLWLGRRHLHGSFSSHLAVANRTGWFVGAEDDAQISHGEVDGVHRHRQDAVVEQAVTGAQYHRKRHEAEAVDQFVLQQRLEESAASPDLQLVARFVFQRPNGAARSPVTRRAVSECSPRHVTSAGLSELDATYLGSELIAVAMGSAGSV